MSTKIDGFFALTHLWAGEAVYHDPPLQLLYVSSMQAIEPGAAVPGSAVANWTVLRLPEVLRVSLGRSAGKVSAACLMQPFLRTGMTEEDAATPKVYGRWQPRMLETHEAARAIAELLCRPGAELDLGNFKLAASKSAQELKLSWSRVKLEVLETPSRRAGPAGRGKGARGTWQIHGAARD